MPREIKTEFFSFETGEYTAARRITQGEATVEERFAGLEALVSEQGVRGSPAVMWMVCDGCGRRMDLSEPKLPEGWVDGPAGDLCPDCS